jgi:hypothetical protein
MYLKKDLLVAFIRYNHVKLCIEKYSHSNKMINLNYIAFICGILSTIGITLVGSFQVILPLGQIKKKF